MAADSPLHVGVLGAGGIGCWLATRLALAGQRVSLLARGGSLAAIQQNGLRAVAVDGAVIGEFRDPELCAYSSTEELPKGAEVDALIVAVKTHQLAACLPQIAAVLRHSPAALVLPMLNGVESQDVIADGLRAEGLDQAAVANVMGGIAKSIVYISEPGCVVLERELGIAVGPVHTPVAGPSQLRVLQAISQFLVTGCIGPFSAAARAPVDVLMRLEETAAVARELMSEMAAVGRAGGVPVPNSAIDDAMAICGRSPPGATYSTTRDVLGGKPSELLEFCGAVVRLGRARGVPTPSHSQLLATLLPQERLARGELAYELRGV